MRTRNFRREKQSSKTKRRVEMYAAINWLGSSTREEFRQAVKNGSCNWIKSTARPCSCNLCKGIYPYKRIKKCDIAKLVKAQES